MKNAFRKITVAALAACMAFAALPSFALESVKAPKEIEVKTAVYETVEPYWTVPAGYKRA